jgi:hypothetical protein
MTFKIKSGIKKSARFFALFLALAAALTCSMQANADRRGLQGDQPLQIYFVSAVLQLKSDRYTIRPVHAIQSARSGDEAEQSFVTLLNRDFPDYSVLTTLTTPASEIKEPAGQSQSFAVSI